MALWTVALQAPLSMGFLRQEYWSGLPFPSPGDLPDPGIEPESPAWQADSLLLSPWPRTLWAWTQWILTSREREGWREEDGAESKTSIAAVHESSAQNPVSNSSSRGTACGRQKEFRLFFVIRKRVLKSLGLGQGGIPVLAEVKEEPLVKLPKKIPQQMCPFTSLAILELSLVLC